MQTKQETDKNTRTPASDAIVVVVADISEGVYCLIRNQLFSEIIRILQKGDRMVKHIVMWKLKELANGKSKDENTAEIKKMLEALPAKIEVIQHLEVGIDFLHGDMSADVVLTVQLASKSDLESYRMHPDHQAVIPFINEVVHERWVIDYEI
jgi:hypothetical protein